MHLNLQTMCNRSPSHQFISARGLDRRQVSGIFPFSPLSNQGQTDSAALGGAVCYYVTLIMKIWQGFQLSHRVGRHSSSVNPRER